MSRNPRKGIDAARQLRQRALSGKNKGGQSKTGDGLDRSFPEALAHEADTYLGLMEVQNYAPRSILRYRDSLRLFLQWAQDRDLRRALEVTKPILESYQRHLWNHRKSNGKPLGISSQRERLVVLRKFFSWLCRENRLPSNPASEIILPRPEKRLPDQALTIGQLDAVLAIPDLTDPLGIRDRAILELFYSTAIRRTELANLCLDDIHHERRVLHVRLGKNRKDRYVPIGTRALRWLDRYLSEVRPLLVLDHGEQALFLTSYGGAFSPDVLGRKVGSQIRASKMGRTGGTHLLRHTCASHLHEAGADIRYIQQLLGHEHLDTTAIYTQIGIKQLQEIHARFHPAEQPRRDPGT
jgi:integrase/recombinase XerD